jgi:hypothetical protein
MVATSNYTSIGELDSSHDDSEEMSIGTMIITGISCGILLCVLFSFCAERWDLCITKKISCNRMFALDYLNENEGSSDHSDPGHGWESSSDDSSSEDSNIRVRHR